MTSLQAGTRYTGFKRYLLELQCMLFLCNIAACAQCCEIKTYISGH